MKLIRLLGISLLLVYSSVNYAQQRFNFLELNGERYNDIGPYYFVDYGNSRDAYARADLLAEALGLDFREEPALLRFEANETVVRFLLTRNVEEGLKKRDDAMVVDGLARRSPSGIWIDSQSYVAISPLTEAFGFQSDFDIAERVLWVNSLEPIEDSAASANNVSPSTAVPQATGTPLLTTPRVGLQENGSSRVVLDLPPGSRYSLFVTENQFVVQFLDANVPAFEQVINDDNVLDLRFALVNDKPGLVVTTTYPLSSGGKGFKRGALAATENNPNERLFIDFSPGLTGAEIPLLTDATITAIASASTTIAPLSAQKTIVLDAGHGAHDPGSLSSYAVEKEVVLSVTLKLRELLEKAGVNVVLTRDRDAYLELEDRAAFAGTEANLFVSIHANGWHDSRPHGIETYIFGEPLDDSLIAYAIQENGGGTVGRALTEEAKNFAQSIAGQIYRENQLLYSGSLAETVQSHLIDRTSARNRGVKQNYLAVLRLSTAPAILVELGFVSNPDEGVKLATDAYQSILAEALASGILEFLTRGGLSATVEP